MRHLLLLFLLLMSCTKKAPFIAKEHHQYETLLTSVNELISDTSRSRLIITIPEHYAELNLVQLDSLVFIEIRQLAIGKKDHKRSQRYFEEHSFRFIEYTPDMAGADFVIPMDMWISTYTINHNPGSITAVILRTMNGVYGSNRETTFTIEFYDDRRKREEEAKEEHLENLFG